MSYLMHGLTVWMLLYLLPSRFVWLDCLLLKDHYYCFHFCKYQSQDFWHKKFCTTTSTGAYLALTQWSIHWLIMFNIYRCPDAHASAISVGKTCNCVIVNLTLWVFSYIRYMIVQLIWTDNDGDEGFKFDYYQFNEWYKMCPHTDNKNHVISVWHGLYVKCIFVTHYVQFYRLV